LTLFRIIPVSCTDVIRAVPMIGGSELPPAMKALPPPAWPRIFAGSRLPTNFATPIQITPTTMNVTPVIPRPSTNPISEFPDAITTPIIATPVKMNSHAPNPNILLMPGIIGGRRGCPGLSS
jgi:hypothetical protein